MDPDATNAGAAVEVRGLVVRYPDATALDGLDLVVPRGAFFGMLGPNGAGKTTTVGVLSTLVRPTAGEARLLGIDVVADPAAVRRRIGLVFQESTLDPDLTPREHLELHARLYHLDERRRRVAEILALVGLEAHAARPVRALSGGLKRRLEIGRGLLTRPRVLFLDEPTLGLDVGARAAIWEQLRRLHTQEATTIFLTTHSMEEADALCGQIAILDAGRCAAIGAPADLKKDLGGDVVELVLEREAGALERLAAVPGVRRVLPRDATQGPEGVRAFRISVADGPRSLARLVEAALPCGVVEAHLHRPSLEHVFLHHTGRAFSEAERA